MEDLRYSTLSKLQIITSVEDNITVLFNNDTGKWKIIEGVHPLEDLDGVSQSLFDKSLVSRNKVITVFFTNVCNLRCTYCRFEELTHHAKEYQDLDIERVVESVKSLVKINELTEIHIQGGEPCLKIELVDEFCRKISSVFPLNQIRYHLTTNGTVINNRVLEVIKKYAIGVTVSIDGLQYIHDKYRTFANGKGSFENTLTAIKIFKEHKISFGVFCVISDAKSMLEIYKYFTETLRINSFLLAPLELEGTEDIHELQNYLRDFYDNQLRLLEKNIDLYKTTGRRISENLTELLLRGKVFPGFYSKACGDTPKSRCGIDMHSIERNGDVTECQNTRLIQQRGKEYINSCLERLNICENCEIRGLCSTPICFSRLDTQFVEKFSREGDRERQYIAMVCGELKRREKMLFRLFYYRKEDILDYLLKR